MLKKATSSRCTRGSSSTESPMHEEATPTESQTEPMEVEDDAPYLDLEGD